MIKRKSEKIKELSEHYTYRVMYSQDDNAFLSTCAEFPSLSAFGKTKEESLKEMTTVVLSTLKWMEEAGESLPTPLSLAQYTGKILLRVSPEKHRELILEAQLNHISMNQLIANKI